MNWSTPYFSSKRPVAIHRTLTFSMFLVMKIFFEAGTDSLSRTFDFRREHMNWRGSLADIFAAL
jgi:hypothetical protein